MAAPVTVGELQRAWLAVQRGDFRALPPAASWVPADGERLVLVVGAAAQSGASTLALAVAEAVSATRLLDCAPTVVSGLVGVCDRELGRDQTGWWQGYRGDLRLERTPLHTAPAPDAYPTPPAGGSGLTVVDAGVEASTLAASRCWLADLLKDASVPVVVTTRCTVPGMRRLATALEIVGRPGRRIAVGVLGPPARRWPAPVRMPPLPVGVSDPTVVCLPVTETLAVHGLSPRTLPTPITSAAQQLVEEGILT